jgi:hypothetical protein
LLRTFITWLTIAFSLVFLPASSHAESLESVLMPGKVIEGHANVETDCKSCHARFKKSAQNALCLDCHKDVAKDVAQKQGYHGRLTEQECRVCHTEHKGRTMNIAPLDEKSFDHKLTDFMLKGGHTNAKVSCRDCHKPKVKFRDAPSDCFACHKKDDKHKGSLGTQCADCHQESDWKKTLFDHSKTKFPLTGKHRDVICKDCHADPKFKGAPTACVACHKKDDDRNGHKGKFGDKCESCHVEKSWKTTEFNHDRDTKYPLRGKHAVAKCESCHASPLFKDKLPTTCIACHEKDDKHKGQEGQKCESCHNERDWKSTKIDHGLTRFPLLGKHAKVECKKCHLTPAFKDAGIACVACHEKDDKHKYKLGPRCETCHNALSWKDWRFDHNKQTSYKLDGGHERIVCEACHNKPMPRKVTLSNTCNSCHEADDVHNGGFGKFCERCHVTSSFKEIRAGVGGAAVH